MPPHFHREQAHSRCSPLRRRARMPVARAEIHAQIASFCQPVVLPQPWSLLPADPAWGLLDAAVFLPAISEQFTDDDLLEAHVFVEGNDGPVLNPAFGIGPQ